MSDDSPMYVGPHGKHFEYAKPQIFGIALGAGPLFLSHVTLNIKYGSQTIKTKHAYQWINYFNPFDLKLKNIFDSVQEAIKSCNGEDTVIYLFKDMNEFHKWANEVKST